MISSDVSSDPTPYASLTPERILDAVESIGLDCDGSLLALNSFENRVWQLGLYDEGPVVAKFYRAGRWRDAQILEEHRFTLELAEAEIPVVAPLARDGQTLHHWQDLRFAVFPRRGGRPPELEDPEVLAWTGRFLGRIHALGATRAFAERPTLDIDTFGREPVAFILASDFLPPELRAPWQAIAEQALAGIATCYQRAGTQPAIRLHGDCHAGNLLWTPDGPHFVDFDDARSGPAMQDLWMLLSGDEHTMARQFDHVLEGYETFASLPTGQLHLIEALRTLRLLHFAAWLARRWSDPAFPAAFPWFEGGRYWQDHILALREQVGLMAESPLVRLCA
ncbi:MAG: serine/threonine protein kinase [Rhodocyclaceae bacterium]|nr:serine/threonine protein kinase [Rhodocyclaceae bacterium]